MILRPSKVAYHSNEDSVSGNQAQPRIKSLDWISKKKTRRLKLLKNGDGDSLSMCTCERWKRCEEQKMQVELHLRIKPKFLVHCTSCQHTDTNEQGKHKGGEERGGSAGWGTRRGIRRGCTGRHRAGGRRRAGCWGGGGRLHRRWDSRRSFATLRRSNIIRRRAIHQAIAVCVVGGTFACVGVLVIGDIAVTIDAAWDERVEGTQGELVVLELDLVEGRERSKVGQKAREPVVVEAEGFQRDQIAKGDG